MSRLKKFLQYLIIFVIIYMIFDFFTYRYLVNSYKNIRTYELAQESPSVTVKEAKATAANGYVILHIKNDTGEKIDKTNVKLDVYNKRENNLSTEYVQLENFGQNEEREVKISFRASNIVHFKVSFTDEDIDYASESEYDSDVDLPDGWLPFAGLVFLFAIL